MQQIQTNILVMGLLFSSPGIHESSTLLSSWPVNSKSKGGFGRAVNQMNTKQTITPEHVVSSLKKSLLSNQKNFTNTAGQIYSRKHDWMAVSMQLLQNRDKMKNWCIWKLLYINKNLFLMSSTPDCSVV